MAWLNALRVARLLRPLGLRWLNERESDSCSEAFAKGDPAAKDPCRAQSVKAWKSASCVAIGPALTPLAPIGQTYEPAWWTDARRPRSLFLGLATHTPPALWIDVGCTPESVAAAWQQLRRTEAAPHTRSFRFLGGEVEPAIDLSPEHSWLVSSPYMIEFTHELFNESPDTLTSESAFSRSDIALFAVTDANGVATLRGQIDYAPATLTANLAQFNNIVGAQWPLDMPIDVVCALMHHAVRPLDEPSPCT